MNRSFFRVLRSTALGAIFVAAPGFAQTTAAGTVFCAATDITCFTGGATQVPLFSPTFGGMSNASLAAGGTAVTSPMMSTTVPSDVPGGVGTVPTATTTVQTG